MNEFYKNIDTVDDRLQPCPFCGGKAFANIPPYADDRDTCICCEQCDVITPTFALGEYCEGVEAAMKIWNDRVDIESW